MLHETIKQRFMDAVHFVASNISLYAVNPSMYITMKMYPCSGRTDTVSPGL